LTRSSAEQEVEVALRPVAPTTGDFEQTDRLVTVYTATATLSPSTIDDVQPDSRYVVATTL
jgi:hypothetical protein